MSIDLLWLLIARYHLAHWWQCIFWISKKIVFQSGYLNIKRDERDSAKLLLCYVIYSSLVLKNYAYTFIPCKN